MKAPRYVVEALRTLVDYCDAHPNCDGCKLLIEDEYRCTIDRFPEYNAFTFEEEENDTSKL